MSALVLRCIACIAMLFDHIGFQYNILPFRIVGRIAFPIFVYLICNGYRHTSDRGKYALRLGFFALAGVHRTPADSATIPGLPVAVPDIFLVMK